MTEPKPTVSQLIENTRAHLDELTERLDPLEVEKSRPTLETLQSDLDLIERALSDRHCNLQSEIDQL